jgi:hypothetical protein
VVALQIKCSHPTLMTKAYQAEVLPVAPRRTDELAKTRWVAALPIEHSLADVGSKDPLATVPRVKCRYPVSTTLIAYKTSHRHRQRFTWLHNRMSTRCCAISL